MSDHPPNTDLMRRLDEIAKGRLLLGQAEAMRALGIGRRRIVKEIEGGRLRYVLVGQRRRFKPGDLLDYIEGQERQWQKGDAPLSDGAKAGSLSSGGPASGSGARTSASTVVDFKRALELSGRTKPKSRPRGGGPTRSKRRSKAKPVKPFPAQAN